MPHLEPDWGCSDVGSHFSAFSVDGDRQMNQFQGARRTGKVALYTLRIGNKEHKLRVLATIFRCERAESTCYACTSLLELDDRTTDQGTQATRGDSRSRVVVLIAAQLERPCLGAVGWWPAYPTVKQGH